MSERARHFFIQAEFFDAASAGECVLGARTGFASKNTRRCFKTQDTCPSEKPMLTSDVYFSNVRLFFNATKMKRMPVKQNILFRAQKPENAKQVWFCKF